MGSDEEKFDTLGGIGVYLVIVLGTCTNKRQEVR